MKYFTIKELCRSTTADRKGIDNRCGCDIEANLTALVDNVLDPLREWYGKPIVVNSGYRCLALNKAVGGATTSLHMSGQPRTLIPETDSRTSYCSSIFARTFLSTS